MRHLIVSRELPPAPYPPGGIGTYVVNLARLLVEAGETVHLIAQRWSGAPQHLTSSHDGRLVVHRVGIDRLGGLDGGVAPWLADGDVVGVDPTTADALARSSFPPQAFAYRAALLAEWLVEHEGIDVIEAQEWEAPLAYFQLRRALGLGPSRQPPCLVQPHSPTESIFRHNEWSTDRADYLPSVRLEDYSIGAADGWITASAYIAREVATQYGLPLEEIERISYPFGDTAVATRSAATWRDGTICFVGRLEPRKGIMEWVEAALRVADEIPGLRFEFIGSDLPLLPDLSVQRALEGRIPPRHRERFAFLGSKGRPELMARLAQARIGVVPSRWENFPNTCIEMMATGLPVIVSPNGGMCEMIDDGETGWIAESGDPLGLADALRRALRTSPDVLGKMGADASARVRRLCDNDASIARHVEVRRRAIERGARRSRAVPPAFPWSRGTPHARLTAAGSLPREPRLGVVVLADAGVSIAPCVTSVASLAVVPHRKVLVSREHVELPQEWVGASNLEGAVAALLAPLGGACDVIAIVGSDHVLDPGFAERACAALAVDPRIGLVAPWTLAPDGACEGGAAPVLPYQLLSDLTGSALVFRAHALRDVGGLPSSIPMRHWCWDVATAVMAQGWAAVAWPELLARRVAGAAVNDRVEAHVGRLRARRAILERASSAIGAWGVEVVMAMEARQPERVAYVDPVPPNAGTGADRAGEWAPTWPPAVDPRAALERLDTAAQLRWATHVLQSTARRGAREPVRGARWFFPRLWMASREALRRVLRGTPPGGST